MSVAFSVYASSHLCTLDLAQTTSAGKAAAVAGAAAALLVPADCRILQNQTRQTTQTR
jgi:hypothetical protein